jgi:hypothetical protein
MYINIISRNERKAFYTTKSISSATYYKELFFFLYFPLPLLISTIFKANVLPHVRIHVPDPRTLGVLDKLRVNSFLVSFFAELGSINSYP